MNRVQHAEPIISENGRRTEPSLPRHQRKRPVWLCRIVWLMLGLGVVGLVILAFLPAPLHVDLVPVAPGPIRITVDAEGKTRIRQRRDLRVLVRGCLVRLCGDCWEGAGRQVVIGQHSGFEAEVRQGLVTGKIVIVYPTAQVAEGKRIRPRG
jgi:hypothetical protein